MRAILLYLAALPYCVSNCLAAIPTDLTVAPLQPSNVDDVNLRVFSGGTFIDANTLLTHTIVINDSMIEVTTRSTQRGGEIWLPSFWQLDMTIGLGTFQRGAYDVHYKLYGVDGGLSANSSTQFTVVPESPAALTAAAALLAFIQLSRRFDRPCRRNSRFGGGGIGPSHSRSF